jgi:hypothetical protein
MTKLQRIAFIVSRAICAFLMATWVINLCTMASLSTRMPEAATAHIEAWNDHGTILYRTPLQGDILVWAWVGALIFGLVGNTIQDKDWLKKIGRRREAPLSRSH